MGHFLFLARASFTLKEYRPYLPQVFPLKIVHCISLVLQILSISLFLRPSYAYVKFRIFLFLSFQKKTF